MPVVARRLVLFSAIFQYRWKIMHSTRAILTFTCQLQDSCKILKISRLVTWPNKNYQNTRNIFFGEVVVKTGWAPIFVQVFHNREEKLREKLHHQDFIFIKIFKFSMPFNSCELLNVIVIEFLKNFTSLEINSIFPLKNKN